MKKEVLDLEDLSKKKIEKLSGLLENMRDYVLKFEEAKGKNDLEEISFTKREILKIQKKINEII